MRRFLPQRKAPSSAIQTMKKRQLQRLLSGMLPPLIRSGCRSSEIAISLPTEGQPCFRTAPRCQYISLGMHSFWRSRNWLAELLDQFQGVVHAYTLYLADTRQQSFQDTHVAYLRCR